MSEEITGVPSQESTTTETNTIETPVTETSATEITNQEQTTQEPQKIKVKYNHEEMELPYEEAVPYIQKGMNYEKAVERARQEALDNWIAEQGYEWNGKPIKTKAEYDQALREAEIRKQLENKELPQEVIDELVESRKFREESKAEKADREKQEKQRMDFQAFFEAYPDVKADTIPAEVWQEVNNGKSLVDAYVKYENSTLKTKLAEFETKFKAMETNEANASTSPGSVTGNGDTKGDFISKEAFEANKKDQKWIIKNLSRIQASRAKW
jgi:hypothetical protein